MHLTSEERAHAIQLLEDSQAEFLDLISGLTSAQWSYREAPDYWSVGETAEHIVLSEAGMYAKITRALSRPYDPDWEIKTAAKTELIERAVPDRSKTFPAPEPLRPRSQWAPDETIARYQEARARSLRFIKETGQPLKAHVSEHPATVFSTLNAYQWLLYIPLHNIRHNRQIANNKARPGFPK